MRNAEYTRNLAAANTSATGARGMAAMITVKHSSAYTVVMTNSYAYREWQNWGYQNSETREPINSLSVTYNRRLRTAAAFTRSVLQHKILIRIDIQHIH